MRKLFCVMLALSLAAILALPVGADVIWEPYDSDFYQVHQADFQLDQEMCYVNSPSGAAAAYDAPGGTQITTLENGTLFQAYYIYTNASGKVWAVNDVLQGDEWKTMYIPMDELLPRYDTQEFLEDAGDDVTRIPPEGLSLVMQEGDPFLYWTYPQGVSAEMKAFWENKDLVPACDTFYTDPEGNTWGHISYWYGRWDAWVCLTDPNNPDLAQPERYTGTCYFGPNAAPLTEPEVQKTSSLTWILPLVAAVLAAGLLLLWPRKWRRKSE